MQSRCSGSGMVTSAPRAPVIAPPHGRAKDQVHRVSRQVDQYGSHERSDRECPSDIEDTEIARVAFPQEVCGWTSPCCIQDMEDSPESSSTVSRDTESVVGSGLCHHAAPVGVQSS